MEPPATVTETTTLVLLPTWATGHLTSMLEFGRRLRAASPSAARLSLTVLVMHPIGSESIDVIAAVQDFFSGDEVAVVSLPKVQAPGDASNIEELVSRYIALHAPHVKAAVAGLTLPVTGLVVDFFATTIFDVAGELSLPAYVYYTSTAAMVALQLRLPVLDGELRDDVELGEVEGGVHVPGMAPLPPSAIPLPLVERKSTSYTWFAYHGRRFMEAKGIIINTVAELEPGVLDSISCGLCVPGKVAPTVYPVGPVITIKNDDDDAAERHACVTWLDGQPPSSVIFLCFGSMGYFESPQVKEVAVALERSGHRFLWVLRGPPAPCSRRPSDANLDEVLPEGFLERTSGRGTVWPSWAPQTAILSHKAVGGFVTHCGWNSTLESLWFGVPLVPWPLYAEQHLNAFELVKEIGVAVGMRVERNKGGFVDAAELERAVRCLMDDASEEGSKARKKAAEMKAVLRGAVEKGGSTAAALERLARDISGKY